MTDFKPQQLDKKWQQQWTASQRVRGRRRSRRGRSSTASRCSRTRPGHAHVGHVRNYIIGDVMARTKRMRGFNVLHPFGWDAFGLPAENAAIKTGTHPETSTLDNIAHMKGQLQRLGISYAWEREIATCLPDYYKFNQWIFLKMFERGLAYRKRSTVNWCPSRQHRARQRAGHRRRLLALRHDGRAARSRAVVLPHHRVRRRAADGPRHADRVAGEGRRDAAELDRPLGRRARQVPDRRRAAISAIEVFTTRIDTIYGATFVLLAPEHPMVDRFAAESPIRRRSASSVAKFRALDREARLTGAIEKEGFDTGRTGDQPVHRRGRCRSGSRTSCWPSTAPARSWRCRRTTSATSSSPASTACRSASSSSRATTPAIGRRDDRGDDQLRPRWSNSGECDGPGSAGGHHADDRRRREARHRHGRGAVPAEGLGHLAAALLGHADSGHPLREGRRRRRCRIDELPVELPEGRRRSPAAAIRRWRRCRSW